MTTPTPYKPAQRGVFMAGSALVLGLALASPAFYPTEGSATAGAISEITPIGVSYADIVEQDKPAVVTITSTMARTADQRMQGQPDSPGGTPFDQFFRQFQGQTGPNGQMSPPERQPRQGMALGSGFIIDAAGVIVTNNHVIDGAEKISVTLEDGRELPATVVGTDSRTDIAVLRIDAGAPLPTVSWGDSDLLRVGDPVIAIGNPFGVGTTVTSGIVSARGRDLHNGPYDDFIQVDAAINHGNSGGALIDGSGNVVGITAAIYSPNDGNVGLGFAIPSDQAQVVVADLLDDGIIQRGYLGVQIQSVSADIANAIGLTDAKGALVGQVTATSPADAAGIQTGDVILSVNGTAVDDARDLSRQIAGLAPGTDAALTLWRDNAVQDRTVTLASLPSEQEMAGVGAQQPGTDTTLGLGLSVLTPDLRTQLGLSEDETGMLVTAVDPASAAASEGVRQGDVVVAVNGEAVGRAGQISKIVDTARQAGRDSVLVLVDRQGQRMFVALPVA